MNTNVDFEEHTVDKEKSTGRKKMHSPKDNRNSAFRNNYKHYQYDYEEDFYEPY